MPGILGWVTLEWGETLGRINDHGLIGNCMEALWGGVQGNCWGHGWDWDGIWGKAWETEHFWSLAPCLGEFFRSNGKLAGNRFAKA